MNALSLAAAKVELYCQLAPTPPGCDDEIVITWNKNVHDAATCGGTFPPPTGPGERTCAGCCSIRRTPVMERA